jgi:stage II sporulation protein AA (anti-sigma F factor antagonist)
LPFFPTSHRKDDETMPVTINTAPGSLTAVLVGDLDHHSAKPIRERIDAAIAEHRPTELVLDFGGITFMDSSGIGLVMGRYRLMEELGGKVVVDNAPTTIKKVMRLSGIDKLATINYGGADK